MGFSVIPVIVMSVIWGVVAIICPFLVPKGPNQSVTRCSLILTGILCWLFWACCYLTQMNPLVGPKLNNVTIVLIAKEWNVNCINNKENKMMRALTDDYLAHAKKVNRYTMAGFSGAFFFIGFILPIFVAHGPYKGLIASCLMLSAICCWLFWLCAYIAQWHPLIGPRMDNYTLVLFGIYMDRKTITHDINDWERIYAEL